MEIIYLEQTCLACPAQFEGKLSDGKELYARYRFGLVSVTLDDILIFKRKTSDEYGGMMDIEFLKGILFSIGFKINP